MLRFVARLGFILHISLPVLVVHVQLHEHVLLLLDVIFVFFTVTDQQFTAASALPQEEAVSIIPGRAEAMSPSQEERQEQEQDDENEDDDARSGKRKMKQRKTRKQPAHSYGCSYTEDDLAACVLIMVEAKAKNNQ